MLIAKKANREQLSNALKTVKSSNKSIVKIHEDNDVEILVSEKSDTGIMNTFVDTVLDTSTTNTIDAPEVDLSTTETVSTHVPKKLQARSLDNIETTVSVSESVVNVLFDHGQGQQNGYILLGRKAEVGNIIVVLRDELSEHEVEASNVQVVGYGKA